MLERIALVLLVGLVVFVAVLAIRRWNASRAARLQLVGPDWSVLGTEPDGRRTLIAFSTPSCAACHKAQAPAIDRVREQVGEDTLRVIRIDAARQSDIATAFGILTVPSTVVLAPCGQRIVAVNHGFAPSTTLLEQLQLA